MRLMKPVELGRISQVLAKGACPICAYLKNDQAALLRGELPPEQVTALCNFHAWALAAAVDRQSVVQIFLNALHLQPPEAKGAVDQCSVCEHLVKREVIHIRDLIEQMHGGLVLDWMKLQGTFCRLHAEHEFDDIAVAEFRVYQLDSRLSPEQKRAGVFHYRWIRLEAPAAEPEDQMNAT